MKNGVVEKVTGQDGFEEIGAGAGRGRGSCRSRGVRGGRGSVRGGRGCVRVSTPGGYSLQVMSICFIVFSRLFFILCYHHNIATVSELHSNMFKKVRHFYLYIG